MKRVLLVVSVLAGCGSDPAESAGPAAPAERAAKLCAAVDAFVADHDVPGAVVATRFANGATHACAAGLASVKDGTPLRTTDRFRIGSVSKTFVAAAALSLVEDGVLSLADPLSRWVPGFSASDPTLAQMLNHTSGLGEYLYDETLVAEQDQPHDSAELLAIARSKPIVRMPGERFEYSNTNYLLMGAVIEAVTGRTWQAIVRERLLDPLALDDTFVHGFEEVPGGFVYGYVWNAPAFSDVTQAMHPTVASSAGCFVSNAHDLLRWGKALYGGEVLNEASMRAMNEDYRVPHAHDGGVYAGAFVGLANFIENDDLGESHGHAGGIPGFVSNLRYRVDDGSVLVVLVNGLIEGEKSPASELTNDAWIALLL